MRARDLLLEARRLFVEEKRGHSKHASGRSSDDTVVPLSGLEGAAKLSITGAIYLAAVRKGLPLSHDLVARAVTVARDSIGLADKSKGAPFADLAEVNDLEPIGLREVVIVLSRACGMKPTPKPEEKKPSDERKDPSYSQALGAGSRVSGEMGSVSAKIAANELEPRPADAHGIAAFGAPPIIAASSPILGELAIELPPDLPPELPE